MGDCRDIESQLAAYVDGEGDLFERGRVEAHLERCPPCRGRAATQRATHDLLVSRRSGLRECAPDALKHRCAAQRTLAAGRAGLLGRRALVPLSLAASLVLAAGLFVMFGWGSSVDTYAAQIVTDHDQCFQSPPADVRSLDPLALARAWEDTNGWPIKVMRQFGVREPAAPRTTPVRIVERPCRPSPVSLARSAALGLRPQRCGSAGARSQLRPLRPRHHQHAWRTCGRLEYQGADLHGRGRWPGCRRRTHRRASPPYDRVSDHRR